MSERDRPATLVVPRDAPAGKAPARAPAPLVAMPVSGRVDTDAMIQRAMKRFPQVREYLSR